MFPIESEDLRRQIVDELIPTYLGGQCSHACFASGMGPMSAPQAGSGVAASQPYELLQRAASRESGLGGSCGCEPLSFEAITDLAEGNGEVGRVRPKRKKKTSALM